MEEIYQKSISKWRYAIHDIWSRSATLSLDYGRLTPWLSCRISSTIFEVWPLHSSPVLPGGVSGYPLRAAMCRERISVSQQR